MLEYKTHFKSRLLWLFPKWVLAFTVGKHIFFRNVNPPMWLRIHERVHVRQYLEHGIVRFLWIYFIKERHLPYKEKTFEVEAYQKSNLYRQMYNIKTPPVTLVEAE